MARIWYTVWNEGGGREDGNGMRNMFLVLIVFGNFFFLELKIAPVINETENGSC